jgi:tetratricopeptide (TPR) repeat protein
LDYVWVAIEGDAAHAPEAFLRLAQLRLLRGEPERALTDLERLRSSHPTDPRIGESWLWTGHAHEALGELEAACAAWRRAEPADPVTRPAVAEALRACEEGGAVFAVQVGAFGEASGAETIRRRLESAGFETYVVTSGDDGLHRVRTGRFMHLTSAALYAERVRRSGFEAVVVLTGPASG